MAQPLEELKKLPQLLRETLARADPAQRLYRPEGAEFSLTEQICHLRDLETEGYLVRITRILNEDRPDLPEFDGAKVAAERDYPSQDPEAALAKFEASRNASLALLSNATQEQLQRTGRIGTFGMISLAELVDRMIEHDTSHTREILEFRF